MSVDKNKARFELLLEHRDTLLLLIGDHNKTSCSDEDPNNGAGSSEYGARCNRCALLTLVASDYDTYDFDVEFNFGLKYEKNCN